MTAEGSNNGLEGRGEERKEVKDSEVSKRLLLMKTQSSLVLVNTHIVQLEADNDDTNDEVGAANRV